MTQVEWDNQDIWCGITRKIIFLDERHPPKPTLEGLHLPFLEGETLRLESADSRTWNHAGIYARPDAVYQFRGGRIVMEYKSRAGGGARPTRRNWRNKVRLAECLQAIISAWVVAQADGQTCASVLRYDDAALFLAPCPETIRDFLRAAHPAKALMRVPHNRGIAASDLAGIAALPIHAKWRARMDWVHGGAVAGRIAHRQFLSGGATADDTFVSNDAVILRPRV